MYVMLLIPFFVKILNFYFPKNAGIFISLTMINKDVTLKI